MASDEPPHIEFRDQDPETFDRRGIRPDVLAGCRARNRAAEAREARERGQGPPAPPKPPRPGAVVLVACACGSRAGFRIFPETFIPTRTANAARKAGWRVTCSSPACATCPDCIEKELAP